MNLIVALLARWGLSRSLALRLAPWVAGAVLIAILGLLWAAHNHFSNRAAVRADRERANAAMIERQIEANEAASVERLRNAETNRNLQRSYEDAILVPKAGDSDDPAVRLACERLRRSGQDTSGLPACGGR
jgi:hypothetical protein